MKILYFSHLCPDTEPALRVLEEEGQEFEARDISLSLAYMKEFLAIRDKNSLFDPVRDRGSIGIPLLVSEDGSLRLDF